MNKKTTGPRVEFLKRKAKLIRKTKGITHTMALDVVALESGFKNWKQYIEKTKSAQDISGQSNQRKRPPLPFPAEVVIRDVFYGRVIGQRPNRNMSTKRHKKVGRILAELLEETFYHKRAHKILFQIRINLDRWLGEEYSPSEMGNAEFNSIYYGSHTEFVDDVPSIRRQTQLRTSLRKVKQILLSAYHDCKSLEKLLEQIDDALVKMDKWPKSIRVKGGSKRQIRSGTFVKVKETNETVVVFNHDIRSNIVVGYSDAGTYEAVRHEVSVLRSQPNISKYKPLRLYLPYGKYILDDGTEILFNRDYCPLWSRSLSETLKKVEVKEVDMNSEINFSRTEHFFFDQNAPYTKNGSVSLEKCLGILNDWGIADNNHKIFDNFREAARRGRISEVTLNRFS